MPNSNVDINASALAVKRSSFSGPIPCATGINAQPCGDQSISVQREYPSSIVPSVRTAESWKGISVGKSAVSIYSAVMRSRFLLGYVLEFAIGLINSAAV